MSQSWADIPETEPPPLPALHKGTTVRCSSTSKYMILLVMAERLECPTLSDSSKSAAMFCYPLGHEFTRKIPDPCLILMLNDMP